MVPSLGLAGAEGRRYRTRRMRINVPKPPRTFLEMDDLVSLTDAAGEQGARIADLRLHAATDAHFRIPDAKTEAGIREVQVSPDLLEEIVTHVDGLRRVGLPTDRPAYLFCNRRGGRLQRQRVNRIVRESATLASMHLTARGLPELPNTTPHTLRRSYISIVPQPARPGAPARV